LRQDPGGAVESLPEARLFGRTQKLQDWEEERHASVVVNVRVARGRRTRAGK
jgi:hypothetical protein